jgi:hypothetical protein
MVTKKKKADSHCLIQRLEIRHVYQICPPKISKPNKPLSPFPFYSRLAELSAARRFFASSNSSDQWKLSRARPPPPSSQPTTVLPAWPRSHWRSAHAHAGPSALPPLGLAAARKTPRPASPRTWRYESWRNSLDWMRGLGHASIAWVGLGPVSRVYDLKEYSWACWAIEGYQKGGNALPTDVVRSAILNWKCVRILFYDNSLIVLLLNEHHKNLRRIFWFCLLFDDPYVMY